jgi:hypothetical protein
MPTVGAPAIVQAAETCIAPLTKQP